jgi:hypothetical protein
MPHEFFNRLFNEHGERGTLLEGTTECGRQQRKRFACLLTQETVKAPNLELPAATRTVDPAMIAQDG